MNYRYEIQYTSKAKSDYYNMLENSLNISLSYYQKSYQNFNSKIQNLLENPYIYPIIQSNSELRKMLISNYILIYEICHNKIVVHRIFSNKIQYAKFI